ncbi:C6 finger domain protein, putative [Talaromyces stipitatus ATCC 10500]|uniref:C6 finger domain protein, putative n=1 Tax=Talaromyces stipitatus (strain ATCC 10500 / CBS 375.48 / QM 6759 / NRRL 1006) TaxID=441959 RepID=B8MJ93_TALSN|nr:C6 finger domain protein, putative [Talaromyces stipitatus ATCC 10500]EED14682.1 C6 finger domain protein, putative [Talaromyces stipitatus ATCC 10500]
MVPLSTAHSLLELFHTHYGRWVKFPEDISISALLSHINKSPLLLCSIFLIAVRHTTQDLADRLAPKLFQEAMRLVTSSLLIVPQPIEFFQAVLILSLWSTTIGQVPLSVDSWLLTGYALQQALASPDFVEIFRAGSNTPVTRPQLDVWCLWNHLCFAHLQYSVGTRRQALLNQEQINHCVRLIGADNVTNYEARMVAESSLYWIIYGKCSGSEVTLTEAKAALQTWQQEWMTLFDQPRSQFLQMGFHFAHLLAYGQFIRSPSRRQTGPSAVIETIVMEMIHHSTTIINLAIETTDERTRHLTDHIYHIVTFSALTLCRLVHIYEAKLQAANHNVDALDDLVVKLIDWLRSIGLPCHAAHMLAAILAAQFNKLRPTYVRPDVVGDIGFSTFSQQNFLGDDGILSSEFIGSEFFNIAIDATPWPQWEPRYTDDEL